MTEFLARFAADRSGATAIEYGLIAGLICVILIGAFLLIDGAATGGAQRISAALGG